MLKAAMDMGWSGRRLHEKWLSGEGRQAEGTIKGLDGGGQWHFGVMGTIILRRVS